MIALKSFVVQRLDAWSICVLSFLILGGLVGSLWMGKVCDGGMAYVYGAVVGLVVGAIVGVLVAHLIGWDRE